MALITEVLAASAAVATIALLLTVIIVELFD